MKTQIERETRTWPSKASTLGSSKIRCTSLGIDVRVQALYAAARASSKFSASDEWMFFHDVMRDLKDFLSWDVEGRAPVCCCQTQWSRFSYNALPKKINCNKPKPYSSFPLFNSFKKYDSIRNVTMCHAIHLVKIKRFGKGDEGREGCVKAEVKYLVRMRFNDL